MVRDILFNSAPLLLSAIVAMEALEGANTLSATTRAQLKSPPAVGARGLTLGSNFSDLFRDPKDPAGVFWAVTDRGPNGEVSQGNEKRRTFAYPEFSPSIVQVRVDGEIIRVIKTLPLRGSNGFALSGLPNRAGIDETPYDCSATETLRFDPAGLDPEGIVRLPSGEFWLSEEYGPSLLRVSAEGQVRERVVPQGSQIVTDAYPVRETLPPVFARRAANRGFESLALSADHRWLFTIVQSPLANPLPITAKTSRIVRLLKLDAKTGTPVSEYVMTLEAASAFGATKQDEMKISGAVWMGPDRLLVDQRTDELAKIYEVDLRQATNILGSHWDDTSLPTLEGLTLTELEQQGIVPAKSALWADLSSMVHDLPSKIEGLAMADAHTLVVGNDNEFAFAGCDDKGNIVPVHRPSEFLFFRFARPVR